MGVGTGMSTSERSYATLPAAQPCFIACAIEECSRGCIMAHVLGPIRSKRWYWLIGLGLLAVTVVALAEPNHLLLGYLCGQSFYHGKPAMYWDQALRDDSPSVQRETHSVLKEGGAAAVPVLVELLCQ